MTDKTIENQRKVGCNCFSLIFSNRSNYKINHFLTFNKDDYYIYKRTGKQKEVSYDKFLEFEYNGYIFFRKDLYSNIEINKWIDFLYSFISISFLDKPFPPIEIINKITIKR